MISGYVDASRSPVAHVDEPGSSMLSCQERVDPAVTGRDGTLGNSSHAILAVAVQLVETMPVHGRAERIVSISGSYCSWKDGTDPLTLSLFVTVTSILSPQSALMSGPGYPPIRPRVRRRLSIGRIGGTLAVSHH